MTDKQNSSQSFNIWHYKPWWCQPWSIILTGIFVVGSSWWILHRIWITLIVGVAIALWWLYFLLLYPRAIAESLKS